MKPSPPSSAASTTDRPTGTGGSSPSGKESKHGNSSRTLFKAARQGRLDAVERLLLADRSAVRLRDEGGRTALHWAARKNRSEVASLLLSSGADPNARDAEEMTPLHLAAVHGLLQDPTSVPDSATSSFFADSFSARRSPSSHGRAAHSPHQPEPGLFSVPGQVSPSPSFTNKHQSPLTMSRKSGLRPRDGGNPAANPQVALIEALDALEEPLARIPTAGKLRPFQERWSNSSSFSRGSTASPKVNGWVADSVSSPSPSSQTSSRPQSGDLPRRGSPMLSTLEVLIRCGAHLNAVDRHGRTPLHWAACKGYGDSVAVLLRHAADHTITDNDGRQAIHLASISGSLMALREMLRHGVDWTTQDSAGRTILHLTAYWGQPLILKELLMRLGGRGQGEDSDDDDEYCAPSELRDADGCTPLHLAAWKGHVEAVEELLWRGADTEAANNMGSTPLHLAALDGRRRITQLLLQSTLDPSLRNNHDESPLHMAAASGHTQLCSQLLRAGAALNVCDMEGATPLHLAAAGGHPLTVTELLHGGAYPEARDASGATALHRAAANGSHETVAAVLSAAGTPMGSPRYSGGRKASKDGKKRRPSASAEKFPKTLDAPRGWSNEVPPPSRSSRAVPGLMTAVDSRGRTALHVAAAGGNAAAARLLLASQGAAVLKVADAAGQLPLHTAVAAGRAPGGGGAPCSPQAKNGASLDNAGYTPLLLAVAGQHADCTAALLEAGADANCANPATGRSALSLAAERGGADLLSLLRHGAAVNAASRVDGRTALHWAVDTQQVQSAEELLVAGASAACADADGRTPLHWAAGRGGAEMVQVLVSAGAGSQHVEGASMLDVQDAMGRTPLHYAVRMGHRAAAEALLKAGARRSIKDAEGRTAMQYSKQTEEGKQQGGRGGGWPRALSGRPAAAWKKLFRGCTSAAEPPISPKLLR
eukprot:CAMPEP_0117688726 /NCGR_PEP_ID=MMETSP0804-20121206/24017_1 /TAXON_ID=1074897 /ORGANISM="Tetraselmis astigmatica, Strain CCMP880" /LENGTH=935 /DNA_ID=CAMNT_0005501265 /DNA_START=422 /DNA_END=3230 /DNA_ORIENTATION=+